MDRLFRDLTEPTELNIMIEQAAINESKPAVHPITMTLKVTLQALALPEENGGFSVIIPALPGCYSDADTIEEAQANAVEAAEGWLASVHDSNKAAAIRNATEPLPGEAQP